MLYLTHPLHGATMATKSDADILVKNHGWTVSEHGSKKAPEAPEVEEVEEVEEVSMQRNRNKHGK